MASEVLDPNCKPPSFPAAQLSECLQRCLTPQSVPPGLALPATPTFLPCFSEQPCVQPKSLPLAVGPPEMEPQAWFRKSWCMDPIPHDFIDSLSQYFQYVHGLNFLRDAPNVRHRDSLGSLTSLGLAARPDLRWPVLRALRRRRVGFPWCKRCATRRAPSSSRASSLGSAAPPSMPFVGSWWRQSSQSLGRTERQKEPLEAQGGRNSPFGLLGQFLSRRLVCEDICRLACDVHASPVISQLISLPDLAPDLRRRLVSSLRGSLLKLTRDKRGCWATQLA